MSRLRVLVVAHPELTGVLALGVALRVGAEVAYHPALFFSDSWAYLAGAWEGTLPALLPDRPNGYPLVAKLLTPGHELLPLIVVQQLAGLATGVLAYAFLVRRGLPRLVGAGAAAVLVLDADAIAVAQHVMPEALFTLALLAVAVLTALRPRDARVALACGALLAFAVTLRTGALFVVPVWLVYLAAHRLRMTALLAAVAVLLVPLLGYSLAMQHRWHHFGVSAAGGWFLYGRVAEIARCDGLDLSEPEMRVCRATEAAQGPDRSAGFFIWDERSPAQRAYGSPDTSVERERRSNAALGEIARAIVRDRPAAYAQLVGRDFLRFFTPGERSPGHSDEAIALPDERAAALGGYEAQVRDRLLPGYVAPARPPAAALHAYQRWAGTPRLALALLLVVGLAAIAAALPRGRAGLRSVAEVALLLGMALALLLGSVVTSAFIVRYLLPAVPLIVCGGLLGAAQLARLARARSSPAAAPSPSV